MSGQPDVLRALDHRQQEIIATTHHGVMARLTDPYLTDHDRWVLHQFARFLAGRTPEPDPRVVRPRAPRQRPLYPIVRRSTL